MYEILGSQSHPDKISIVLDLEVAYNYVYVFSVPEKLAALISREESPYLDYYEDGDSNRFRNFGTCIPKYMASYPRLESACETFLETSKTEVFPCFFLSFKANARVRPAKMRHGTHSS
jgi:hypothetical protein